MAEYSGRLWIGNKHAGKTWRFLFISDEQYKINDHALDTYLYVIYLRNIYKNSLA